MTDTRELHPESRILIDGALVDVDDNDSRWMLGVDGGMTYGPALPFGEYLQIKAPAWPAS